MEVPERVVSAVSLSTEAETMFDPGAQMSTQGPTLEKKARRSVGLKLLGRSVAATVTAAGTNAGDRWHASCPLLLPAATTVTIPAACACRTTLS